MVNSAFLVTSELIPKATPYKGPITDNMVFIAYISQSICGIPVFNKEGCIDFITGKFKDLPDQSNLYVFIIFEKDYYAKDCLDDLGYIQRPYLNFNLKSFSGKTPTALMEEIMMKPIYKPIIKMVVTSPYQHQFGCYGYMSHASVMNRFQQNVDNDDLVETFSSLKVNDVSPELFIMEDYLIMLALIIGGDDYLHKYIEFVELKWVEELGEICQYWNYLTRENQIKLNNIKLPRLMYQIPDDPQFLYPNRLMYQRKNERSNVPRLMQPNNQPRLMYKLPKENHRVMYQPR